jgi:5'(3')-deoxyribonucleotidase
MNRPTILVDLDGVVYDWVGQMAQYLHIQGVIEDPVKAIQDHHTWEIWEDWGIPEGEFMRWWRLGVEGKWIYAMGGLIPGARTALWRLSDMEWNIHIATSRLTKFGLHDKIVENTVDWLRSNNIPYRNLSFTANKRDIIADAAVDDNESNLSAYFHVRPYLFGAPHNNSNVTWDDIVKELVIHERRETEAMAER